MTEDQGPLHLKMAHLEDMLKNASADITDVKGSIHEAVEQFDRRLSLTEVAVRALEDRELRRKTLEEERLRSDARASDERAEIRHNQITRRELWLAVVTIICGTATPVIVALLTHHTV